MKTTRLLATRTLATLAALSLLLTAQAQAQPGPGADEAPAASDMGGDQAAEVSPWLPKPPKPDADPFAVAWHGQLRVRGIANSGKDFVETDMLEREYITQRARLTMDAKTEGGLKFGLQVQDTRIWGEEMHTLNDKSADGLDMHQAWAQIPLPAKLQLKVGRQEIIHDDARLIGNVGWVQRAQSFDGIRVLGERGLHKYDAFWLMIRERELADPDGSEFAQHEGNVQLGGLHGTLIFGAVRVAPAYYLRLNGANNETRHTAGVRVDAKTQGFTGGGAFYYQAGSIDVADAANPDETKSEDIGAMLIAADAGYTLDKVFSKPSFKVFGDFLPGKDLKDADGKVVEGAGDPLGVFDTLYATNHKFYGEMDFILNVPAHTKARGLLDVGAQVKADVHKKVKLMVTGHFMQTTVADAEGEKTLGTEVDIKAMMKPLPHVGVNVLAAVFLPGEGMRSIKGIDKDTKLDTEVFGYVTCNISF